MKKAASNGISLLVESINYVILNYALSNMAMLLVHNPVFILFYASELWVMGRYWQKAKELTGSRALSAVLLVLCFVLHMALVYFVGRVEGQIVPFAGQ